MSSKPLVWNLHLTPDANIIGVDGLGQLDTAVLIVIRLSDAVVLFRWFSTTSRNNEPDLSV